MSDGGVLLVKGNRKNQDHNPLLKALFVSSVVFGEDA